MKNRKIALSVAVLSMSLVSAPLAALASSNNFLKDASFESQLPADQGGWRLFKDSRFSSDQARSGQQSMFNSGFSHTVPFPPFLVGKVSGSYQEFPAAPRSRWRLTGYGIAPVAIKGGPAFGIVQVSFFDARGKDLGTVETAGDKSTRARLSNAINQQSPAREWIFLDTGIATAPAGAVTVQAFTLYVDFSGSNVGQGVFFDDLNLCSLDDNDEDGSGCEDFEVNDDD
jgi:hypothetical protein